MGVKRETAALIISKNRTHPDKYLRYLDLIHNEL